MKKANLGAVRAACEATRQERELVRGWLAKGSRAIRWVMTGDLGLGGEADVMEQTEEVTELVWVIDGLVRCATGEIGERAQCSRAAALVISALSAAGEFAVPPDGPGLLG